MKKLRPMLAPALLAGICFGACALPGSSARAAAPDFARDVRPILERSCFGCHGPEKQRSGYRLDIRDVALKGGDSGKAAIIPHNAKASPLIRYVSGEDSEMLMPPSKSTAPRLSAAEVQTLREWIDAGPAWPDAFAGKIEAKETHWSLKPLVQPKPPRSGNAIDAFIHAKLAEKKLKPSKEADRRTLIRRVTYDLTGLPPTPEEVAAFVADKDSRAYEKLVDLLLASPRYGERWARHWFDTIHFADSHGFEHDIGRDNAWRYRDYVIEAFNKDTEWARFIREQLAADVFFPEEPRLTAALGFLGAGTFDLSTYTTTTVTFDYLDRDDLVTQTMAAFSSTTANCARCHAHKFDPISQEDYYALQAVFAGIIKGDVRYDEDPSVARERKRLQALLTAVEKKDVKVLLAAEHVPAIEKWVAARGPEVHWQTLAAETFVATEETALTRTTNGFLASGSRPDKDTYIITATTTLTNLTALRLDLLPHDSLPKRGPGRMDNGNMHLSEVELRLFEPNSTNARQVKIKRATADFNQDGWPVERAIDGDVKTSWAIFPAVGQAHHAVFEVEPVTCSPGTRISITLKQVHGGGHLLGAFQLSVSGDDASRASALPLQVSEALVTAPNERTERQRVALAAHVLGIVAREQQAKLPAQSVVYAAAPAVDLVSGDPPTQPKSLAEPKVVHVLHRGEFDKPREAVQPGALSALKDLPARFALKNPKNEAERRAALADWLAHRDNVLTWRSVVNRVWHYHFGRGLCDTPSDFGTMGGAPSHPELIDWLAVWFRDEAKGSLKELHRLIVTSTTYRQSSEHRADAVKLDGDNRLLWRQNRDRLDADAFRDFTLAASGALDLKMGGPGIQHFKKSKGPQTTPTLDYSNYDWSKPEANRRSIYRYVWRGIADPMMESLDFPDLGLLAPARSFSASSLQALTLYNNDFVLHHSGVMAKRVEREADSIEKQVERAVQLVWLRAPTRTEQGELVAFARERGLPALCRVLLNSNEFLFVD